MSKLSSGFSLVLALVVLGLGGAGAYMLLHDLSGPSVALTPDRDRVGPAQDLTVKLQDPAGVRSVAVSVRRNGQSMTVFSQTFPDKATTREAVFSLKDAKLPEGQFELEIKAYDGSFAGFGKGNSATVSLPMRLDSQPPRIAVKTLPPNVKRGGSALIVYTVSEDVDQTGVKVGPYTFAGRKQPGGAYACLFAFPYTMDTGSFAPEIMARDLAGNLTSSRLLINAQTRTFKADKLTIDDKFLAFKADELAALCPEKSTTLEQYICVNNKERVADDAFLLKLGQDSTDAFLWTSAFQRMPRSAPKAGFGDFRTYLYNGEKIDEQTHTGLDLASTLQADVPAASEGRVVFADRLGIYGNLVVIDHGLGLMSVYSHLSEIAVAVGDTVAAGHIVGKTGVTGLAGGDHVHFGFLVGGIPVHPLEWLDPAWVKNNVTARLATPVS